LGPGALAPLLPRALAHALSGPLASQEHAGPQRDCRSGGGGTAWGLEAWSRGRDRAGAPTARLSAVAVVLSATPDWTGLEEMDA